MAAASSQPKETECAVCTNDFTTPKILPCGHLLCRECVISWVDQKLDAGCPLCRCPIVQTQEHSGRSSSDVADALPTDFAMEALVDSATVLSKNRVCCACDDVRAEYFCMQCQDVLCSPCCKMHKKIPGTRSHDVESLSSVTPERLAASRPALCADHKDKQADVICVTHDVCVCTACAITKHRSCPNVKDTDSEMNSAEDLAKRLMDFLLMAVWELEQSIAEVDRRLEEVNAREQDDIKKVGEICERLRNKMEEMSRIAHSEVKDSLQDIKRSLNQYLGIVMSHKGIMSRTSAVAPRPTLIHAIKALQDRVNSLDLRADLKVQVWGDPTSYGTRCNDAIGQIEKELRMSAKQSKDLEGFISAEAQTFWLQWVEAAFPDLHSRAYFLPPVHVKRLTTGQSSAGQPPPIHDSEVRDDADLQRVFSCLQKLSEENGDVLVGMSQLQFGQYLGQPCYSAAAAHLLESCNLRPALSGDSSAGDFDVLLIHRQFGLVAIQIKCFTGNLEKCNMSQVDLDNNIRRNLKEAVLQLVKTKAMLSHLVSDIAPGLRITKTIAFPNLTANQVQQAVSSDPQLSQDVCWCLGTADAANIPGLCLFSDQLSDPRTPWDVTSDVLRELGNWWQRRVTVSGSDSHMTCDVYKTLVVRLCGPATTVTVPCTSPPRLCVKTLGQAVSLTGKCYTAQITLFPEQVHLVNTAPSRLFVSGPPGTGKTVVLLLMARQWLRLGNGVYIVSTWCGSRAACIMLYYLLLQTVNSQDIGASIHLHLLQYDFNTKKTVKMAVDDLSQAAKDGPLYVIADEPGPRWSGNFQTFCDKLLRKVPRLHLWAASCYHGHAPAGWQEEYLTRPLRSPPAVVREVQQDEAITKKREVLEYNGRVVSDHTDDLPVKLLYHGGHCHSGDRPCDCDTCGRQLSSFLHSLRVGLPVNLATASTTTPTTSGDTTPPCLQWRDVLVLCSGEVSEQSGVMTGLREAGIPVRVMTDDDTEDVATARSDVVWVATGDYVRGLERKVVVCLEYLNKIRLQLVSRCSSQLVIVSPDE